MKIRGCKVFAKGSNSDYQCGTSADCRMQWVGIALPCETKSISCGYYHTMIITENDLIYACGSNSDGQIGIESEPDEYNKFSRVTAEEKYFANVECGGYYSMILTENGDLYAWGKVHTSKIATNC